MEHEIYNKNLSLNNEIMATTSGNLLSHQAEILDEFNRYKFLRPMKKKLSIILNRLHNRNNESTKNNNVDNKTFSKKIVANLIDEFPGHTLIAADNIIVQYKYASFKGKVK